jgi:hypothetical protein
MQRIASRIQSAVFSGLLLLQTASPPSTIHGVCTTGFGRILKRNAEADTLVSYWNLVSRIHPIPY